MEQFLSGGIEMMGASTVVLFAALFFGTFLSEDAACLAAGALVASGQMSFPVAVTACFAGIFVGDMLLYWVGRSIGKPLFANRYFQKIIPPGAVDRASKWLDEKGASAIFLSRFISGLRLPTYVIAGALKTNFTKFAVYFLIASAIWTPVLVGAAAYAQAMLFSGSALLGLAAMFIALRIIWKLSTWKGRRLFLGRLKRYAKWEFWPLQIFYLPVVLYTLVLGVRHRGLNVFTSANPAIPAGGFRGESKNEIYRGLSGSLSAEPHLLKHLFIDGALATEERRQAAEAFLHEQGLEFPVVIKPDKGERGQGVRIIRDLEQMRSALQMPGEDLILQEFAAGEEASLFYYRHVSEDSGRIFSMTEKFFPVVVGDGKSTLEELILKDERAICLAGKYLERNEENLDKVPPQGDVVSIIDIGTHSRGAVFRDGGWLASEALLAKIDEISKGYKGFYFGRFDIRSRSFEDLKEGRNFKIVELNGVTSESTNIYDPRYSLIDAYRILFRQWRLAYEIGSANIAAGHKPASIWELFRLAFFSSRHEKPAILINRKNGGELAHRPMGSEK